MTDIVFLDTETTGLSLDDEIWEFAAIRRDGNSGHEETVQFFIEHDRKRCAQLPEKFRADHYNRFLDHQALDRESAALRMRDITARAHVVGAVPNFDTERIAIQLASFNLKPFWHYHLIDVENLIAGRLAIAPPWDSDELSRKIGVDPDRFERHTALGDAMWAREIYDVCTVPF